MGAQGSDITQATSVGAAVEPTGGIGGAALAARPPRREGLVRTLTRIWRDQATQEYLQAYRRAMEGVASFPTDDLAGRQLLDFFLIEKALYELKYELANRPDWVEIPVRGLLALLGDDDA